MSGFFFAGSDPASPSSSSLPPEPVEPMENTQRSQAIAGNPEPSGSSPEVREVLFKLLPWTTSLLLHVVIVLVAIFLVWSVRYKLDDEEVIIPDARLSATPTAPLRLNPTPRKTFKQETSRRQPRVTQNTLARLTTSNTPDTSQLIGTLGASAGQVSPFGSAIRSGTGLQTSLYGIGGNARKIVYVIDASGSLIDTLDDAINELKRSVMQLTEEQWFTVIFFQGGKLLEFPPARLKTADGPNKQQLMDWLDPESGHIVAGHGSDPVKAIKRALQYRPQLVYLLSDNITGKGIYEVDQRRLLRAIRKTNRHKTKINTIQFVYPDPLVAKGFKATMELIATESGGLYRFVSERELR